MWLMLCMCELFKLIFYSHLQRRLISWYVAIVNSCFLTLTDWQHINMSAVSWDFYANVMKNLQNRLKVCRHFVFTTNYCRLTVVMQGYCRADTLGEVCTFYFEHSMLGDGLALSLLRLEKGWKCWNVMNMDANNSCKALIIHNFYWDIIFTIFA